MTFWFAYNGDNKYAIGTGDHEIAIVTGPNEDQARNWASIMAKALNEADDKDEYFMMGGTYFG